MVYILKKNKNMPNGERVSDKRFSEWVEALAPYANDVEEFAREKELRIVKWRMNDPRWLIGRTQHDELDKIWWTIQFGYNERDKKLGLVATARIDREFDVAEGRVHERRLSDSPEKKHLIATWQRGAQVNMKELLEEAYERATSYTEQDLTSVHASITGKDGRTRPYNPQLRSQA